MLPSSHARRLPRLAATALTAAVVLAPIALTTNPASAAYLRHSTFNAGFAAGESPSVPSPNPYGASVTLDRTRVYEGAAAAKAHTGQGPGIQYARTLYGGTAGTTASLNWGAGKDVWYGMAIYLPAGFNAAMQSYFVPMRWDNYGVSNVTRNGLAMYGDGTWRLFRERDGVERQTNLLASTFKVSEGAWHFIEVHQKLSATAGSALNELYIDGTKIGSSTARNYYGQPASAIRYGIVATDQTNQTKPLDVWFDETFVADAYVAPLRGPTADTAAPSAPPSLTAASTTRTGVTLSWGAATDNVGVTRYEVWRGDGNWSNWTLVSNVTGSTRSAAVSGLSANTAYTFGIRAFDAAGNKSPSSNVVRVTTLP
jgi:hypothetical protein